MVMASVINYPEAVIATALLCTAVYYSLCAQSHAYPTYILVGTLETKAPLQCLGQPRPCQHTHNTHLGAVPHVVSHHVDKGPLVLDKRFGEEPMLVGGDLNR